MDESGGQDDTRTKLLQDHKEDVLLRHARELGQQHGHVDADGTGDQDDEQQSNTQAFVVGPVGARACRFGFGAADAVSDCVRSGRRRVWTSLTLRPHGSGSFAPRMRSRLLLPPLLRRRNAQHRHGSGSSVRWSPRRDRGRLSPRCVLSHWVLRPQVQPPHRRPSSRTCSVSTCCTRTRIKVNSHLCAMCVAPGVLGLKLLGRRRADDLVLGRTRHAELHGSMGMAIGDSREGRGRCGSDGHQRRRGGTLGKHTCSGEQRRCDGGQAC